MSEFIKLHSSETEDVILLRTSAIISIVGIPSEKTTSVEYEIPGESMCFPVTETPDEIGALINEAANATE